MLFNIKVKSSPWSWIDAGGSKISEGIWYLYPLFPKLKGKESPLQNQGLRYFTPREVANLHSFPEEFCFPEHVSLKQRNTPISSRPLRIPSMIKEQRRGMVSVLTMRKN